MAAPNQFDYARQRAQQQETANVQTQKDAMNRRLAAQGGGPGGVALKQDQIISDQSAQRLDDANQSINAQQTAHDEQLAEAEKQRQFAHDERLGSQDFTGSQNQMQRQFQTGERLGSQEYSSGENAMQRRFQTGERLGGQDFGAAQAELQRKFQTGERLSTQDYATLEALKQRQFQTGERLGTQTFQTGERQGAEAFAGKQATQQQAATKALADRQNDVAIWTTEQNQQFAGQQAALDRQLKDSQFGQQMELGWANFHEDENVNRINADLAHQTLAQKGPLEQLFGNFSPGNLSNLGSPQAGGFIGQMGNSISKMFG